MGWLREVGPRVMSGSMRSNAAILEEGEAAVALLLLVEVLLRS